MELADTIEEIKTTCARCERKATQNARLVEAEGQVLIGGDEAYAGLCFRCYFEHETTNPGGRGLS